ILREAFWPSEARIWGWVMSLLVLSVSKKLAVAAGMVTAKFVALRLASWFKVMVPVAAPVVVVTLPFPVPTLVPVVEVVVLVLLCKATVMLAGGWMPRLRSLS